MKMAGKELSDKKREVILANGGYGMTSLCCAVATAAKAREKTTLGRSMVDSTLLLQTVQ